MVKRILSVFALTAVLFSAHADLLLYTFEGSITSINQYYDIVATDISVSYQILMDFDEPAIINGQNKNDISYTFTQYDYGSAELLNNTYYSSTDLTFKTKEALHITDIFGNDENTVLFENYEGNTFRNGFLLSNHLQSNFEVGDNFGVTEIKNPGNADQYRIAMGSVTLTSKGPLTAVPEAGTLSMLAFGLVSISFIKLKK